MDTIQVALETLLVKIKADNEIMVGWIKRNVGEEREKEPALIRALMTAVCKSAIIRDDDTGQRCDTQAVQKRVVLLQKYLDNESTRELQALFALQALMVQLDQPPILLRRFFEILYDEALISEEAFFAWESNTDPAEQEGKASALAHKSVTVFFTLLRELRKEENDG
ncbi:eukaryotic translation initiation factor 4 gamma 3-like [Branchiostoma floridae x Branchiostoma belcheri]